MNRGVCYERMFEVEAFTRLHPREIPMNITEIRIKLLLSQRDKLRGFASITLDDCLVIRDIKVRMLTEEEKKLQKE